MKGHAATLGFLLELRIEDLEEALGHSSEHVPGLRGGAKGVRVGKQVPLEVAGGHAQGGYEFGIAGEFPVSLCGPQAGGLQLPCDLLDGPPLGNRYELYPLWTMDQCFEYFSRGGVPGEVVDAAPHLAVHSAPTRECQKNL